MMDEERFEIQDMENFSGGGGNQEFSHQALVMSSLSRCGIALAREMKAGFWNEKLDKFGNVIRTYIDDTRLNFIESVKSAEINMSCDFDDEIIKNIKELKEQIGAKKSEYLLKEAKEWELLPKKIRELRLNNGVMFRAGILNENLPFLNEFLLEKVKIYEDIYRQLIRATKKNLFYEQMSGEA